MQAHERLKYLPHYTHQKFGNNLLMRLILFLNVQTWKNFSFISTIFIKKLRLLWRRKVMENQRFLTLCRNGIMIRSLHWYRKPTHTDQYLHYSSHDQASCKENVVSSFFNRTCSIITNYDLYKENARIKKVLKENRYQENIINKSFQRIANNHSLPQSQQQTQATDIQEEEIRMSINLPYVEGTSEKLRRILTK